MITFNCLLDVLVFFYVLIMLIAGNVMCLQLSRLPQHLPRTTFLIVTPS